MSFYADPSFFVLLSVAVVGAAVLGLLEKPLKWYGLVASLFFVVLLFMNDVRQLACFVLFLASSAAGCALLMRAPKSKWRFRIALALTLYPLVVCKVSGAFDASLLGFAGISYLTFKATQVVIEVHDDIIERMSLMAIGASYCFGIRTPRNFRAPFLAVDIKDFWNRWHITLSFWLRDFVFMRFSRFALKHKLFKKRLRVAQCGFMVNMLLMGAWHGLTADYLLYGLFHGVLLAMTEAFQKTKFYKAHKKELWFRGVSWFATMQAVFFGFALFSGQITRLACGA